MEADEERWVENSLVEADRRRCVSKVLSISRSDVVAKGDNYASDLSRLRLKVALVSGDVEERTVIYKSLPSTELRKKHMAGFGIFVIEKRMYKEVLPLMEKIQKEKDCGEPVWGGCYEANTSNLLLEDLGILGYKMGDRMKGLDFEHCKLVMKSLGKFHALGAVLKERGELIVSDFDRHFLQKNLDLMSQVYKSSFTSLADALETQWEKEWIPYAEKLRKKSELLMDDLVSTVTSTEKSRFMALNHGDCWVNNMLFKYGEDGKPTSLKFIDFQMCFYGRVGADLQYFLSTSPRTEERPKTDEFLKIYQSSLKDNLTRLGYGEKVPTLDDIREDFADAGTFGLASAIMVVPFLKAPSKNAPDVELMLKEYDDAKSLESSFYKNTSADYAETMQAVLKEAEDKGVL